MPIACRANDAAPADHRGERVQPPHQHRLALYLGVTERRALLGVPVHPALHRVHVDEGQLARAGQQRRPPGQPGQQLPVHLLQLADIPPGERPQERPQRGRRPHPAEQRRHRPVPQQAQVIDAVCAGDHPGDQAPHLQVRIHPAPAGGPDVLVGQGRQAGALGQGHHRHQTCPRHEIRVVKRCLDLGQAVQQSVG